MTSVGLLLALLSLHGGRYMRLRLLLIPALRFALIALPRMHFTMVSEWGVE